MNYQAVVIGAGPAGSTAAYHLSRAGISTLIVEAKPFPRMKPCGGGITPRVRQELDFDISAVIEKQVKRTIITENYSKPIMVERDRPMLYTVRREHFDQALLKRALDAGAVLRHGKVTEVIAEGNSCRVRMDDGSEAAGCCLVGADGARGITYKHLNGHGGRKYAVTIEASVPAAGDAAEVRIDYGILPSGYGWTFAKNGQVSVGVGTFARQSPNLRQVFWDYLSCTGMQAAAEGVQLHGYILPFCTGSTVFQRGNIYLCGDAAGLADPFSGEGIYNAVKSGRMAAEVIMEAGRGGAADNYARRLREEILPELRRAWWLNMLFYPRSRMLHKVLYHRHRVAEDLLDTIFGERTYRGLPWRAARLLLVGS